MKVRIRRGNVCEINKSLSHGIADGENVGILRFDEVGGAKLREAADAIIGSGNHKCWAPAAVDRIAQDMPVNAIDVADLPWTEIDFPEDLAHARENIWPAIVNFANSSPAIDDLPSDCNGASKADRLGAPELLRGRSSNSGIAAGLSYDS